MSHYPLCCRVAATVIPDGEDALPHWAKLVTGDWVSDTGRLLSGEPGSKLAYRCGKLNAGAIVTLGFLSIAPGMTVYVAANEDLTTGIQIEFLFPAPLGSADPCVNVTVRQDRETLFSTDMGTEYFIDTGDFVTGTPRGLVAGVDFTDPDKPRVIAGAITLDFDQIGATMPADGELWVGFGLPTSGGSGTMEVTKVFIDLNGGEVSKCCAAPGHPQQCWEGSTCGKPPNDLAGDGPWTITDPDSYVWRGALGNAPGDWWTLESDAGLLYGKLTQKGGKAVRYFMQPIPPCYDPYTGTAIEHGDCGNGRQIANWCNRNATDIARVFRVTECAEVTISATSTRGSTGIGTAVMGMRITEDGCKNPRGGTGYVIWESEVESGPDDSSNCVELIGGPGPGYMCNTARCSTEEADTIDHTLTLSPGFYVLQIYANSSVRCTCYEEEEDPDHPGTFIQVPHDQYSEAIFKFAVDGTGIEIVTECLDEQQIADANELIAERESLRVEMNGLIAGNTGGVNDEAIAELRSSIQALNDVIETVYYVGGQKLVDMREIIANRESLRTQKNALTASNAGGVNNEVIYELSATMRALNAAISNIFYS